MPDATLEDIPFHELKARLGFYGKTLTLPFSSDGVPSLLYALKEKRWLRSHDEVFRVVAATYDKHFDEVTFLFDYTAPAEPIAGD